MDRRARLDMPGNRKISVHTGNRTIFVQAITNLFRVTNKSLINVSNYKSGVNT